MATNQRVIHSCYQESSISSVVDAAGWLDGLIGNPVGSDKQEIVESIAQFQVIQREVQYGYRYDVIAVVNTRYEETLEQARAEASYLKQFEGLDSAEGMRHLEGIGIPF